MPTRSLLAVVLIYDIRGFSAAARNTPEEPFGAFITEAHARVLPLFPKPTFLKNLGDGNLLLWEVGAPPTPEWLEELARACVDAQRAFASLAAGQTFEGMEYLPHDVGFGIAYGPVTQGDDYYGNAINLAARLQDCARPRGIVFDEATSAILGPRLQRLGLPVHARRASLKGVGRVRFHWVARLSRRERWERSVRRIGRFTLPLAAPLLLYSWIDAGLPFPEAGRATLDELDISVFRPHPSPARTEGQARALAASLAGELGAKEAFDDASGRVLPERGERDFYAWTDGEVTTALLIHHPPPEVTARVGRDLDALFAGQVARDGRRLLEFVPGQGFLRHLVEPYPHGDTTAWVLLALLEARGDPSFAAEAVVDERIGEVWQALRGFYDPTCRGWHWRRDQSTRTALGDPDPRNEHYVSVYTATLAAWALVEARRLGLALDDRDDVLRATLDWLSRHYIPGARGWTADYAPGDTRFAPNEVPESYADGLTFQVYTVLLAAERWARDALPEGNVPPAIRQGMYGRLRDLVRRSLLFPVSRQRWMVNVDEDGRPRRVRDMMDFYWIPWATSALSLERALHAKSTRERVELARSLGHVLDLGEQIRGAGVHEPAQELIGLTFADRR